SLARQAEPVVESPAVEPPAPEVGDDGGSSVLSWSSAAIEAAVAQLPATRASAPERPEGPGGLVWLGAAVIAGGLAATGLLAAGQAWRILRFRRRLRMAVPAPDDLVAEAERVSGQLGGRVPELLVVPELGSPMLWCLGRPKLLLPAPLVKAIDR